MSKTTVIDGVTIKEVTPELTQEEERKRINEIAESLIAFNKNRKTRTA